MAARLLRQPGHRGGRSGCPPVNATYKCGITFEGWSTKPGFEKYFHPFASDARQPHDAPVRAQRRGAHQRRQRACAPDRFFIATTPRRRPPGAEVELRPSRSTSGTATTSDAVLLGQFLQRKAVERGVATRAATSRTPRSTADGAIESVSDAGGRDHRRGPVRRLQRFCRSADRRRRCARRS